MTWQIGRAVLTDLYGRDEGPNTITQSGETLVLSGVHVPTTRLVGKQFRQNLLGHAEAGDTVPLVTPQSLDLTGYYRVSGASVVTMPNTDEDGKQAWTVSLEREPDGFALPAFEVVYENLLRPNSMSVTAGTQVIAWPHTTLGGFGPDSSAPDPATESGEIKRYTLTVANKILEATHAVYPPDFYNGAATVQILDMDDFASGPYPIAGRQFPRPYEVVVSNGLIRIYISYRSLTISRWTDGAGWSAGRSLSTSDTVPPITTPGNSPAISVNLNTPERCSVTYIGLVGNAPTPVTVSVARGQYFAEIQLADDIPSVKPFRTGTFAQANASYGQCFYDTTPIAGYDPIIASATIASAAAGVVTPNANRISYGVGMATAANRVSEVLAPYFGTQSESQRTVT